MKKLSELIKKIAAKIEARRRAEEVTLIHAELRELAHWRELGAEREPRLYKRLVELGEHVPAHMLPASFAKRHPALQAQKEYLQDLWEGDGMVGVSGSAK